MFSMFDFFLLCLPRTLGPCRPPLRHRPAARVRTPLHARAIQGKRGGARPHARARRSATRPRSWTLGSPPPARAGGPLLTQRRARGCGRRAGIACPRLRVLLFLSSLTPAFASARGTPPTCGARAPPPPSPTPPPTPRAAQMARVFARGIDPDPSDPSRCARLAAAGGIAVCCCDAGWGAAAGARGGPRGAAPAHAPQATPTRPSRPGAGRRSRACLHTATLCGPSCGRCTRAPPPPAAPPLPMAAAAAAAARLSARARRAARARSAASRRRPQ